MKYKSLQKSLPRKIKNHLPVITASIGLFFLVWFMSPAATQAVLNVDPVNILDHDLQNYRPIHSFKQFDLSKSDACQILPKWRSSKSMLYLSRQKDLDTLHQLSQIYLEKQKELLTSIARHYQSNLELKSRSARLLKNLHQKQFKRLDLNQISSEITLSETEKHFYLEEVLPLRVGLKTLIKRSTNEQFGQWFDRWTVHEDSLNGGEKPYLAMADSVLTDRKNESYRLLANSHKTTLIRDLYDRQNAFESSVDAEILADGLSVSVCTRRKYWQAPGILNRNLLEESHLHERYQNLCSRIELLTGKIVTDIHHSLDLSFESYQEVEERLATQCWQKISG